ncbi:phage holin family protein [Patescibacteria group bacterium]|nr:phage holin family protein [Patescibacteria group bacterium]
MGIIINLLTNGLAVVISAYLLPGVRVDGYLTAVMVAIVLGILNAIIKPILLIFTLPINILTLGLFTFVINAFIILIASSLVAGFHVLNFWWALLFSLILSIINSLLHYLIK